MNTDILIIGAGLSGLALARRLEESGKGYLILEARDRVGGRILSSCVDKHIANRTRYDMGPAWFWPGQPLVATLANDLDLTVFEQYAAGNLVFEAPDGSIRRDITMAPMAGSLRLDGGLEKLVEGIAGSLRPDRLMRGHVVETIRQDSDTVVVTGRNMSDTFSVQASHVVLALPPRLTASLVTFEPDLPRTVLSTMQAVPTWMAGHAKVITVYDTPFWRAQGLSGDAISHRGPLAEIHDASPMDGSAGALFGFAGVTASVRRQSDFDLEAASLQQLERLFGPKAGTPSSVLISDWATETFTATRADDDPPAGHPNYGLPAALDGLWDGKLMFGSSEMAPVHGGFLEGALERAEQLASTLM